MMNKSKFVVLFIFLASLTLFHFVKKANLSNSKLIIYPIYKDYTGGLFVKFGNGQIIRYIENEFKDGEIIKINIPIDSIDLDSFTRVDSIVGPITHYRDRFYIYTFHDGEEKLIIREKVNDSW